MSEVRVLPGALSVKRYGCGGALFRSFPGSVVAVSKSGSQDAERVFLGLGSNLGDRLDNLRRAVMDVRETQSVSLVAASGVYETAAHLLGAQPQNDFLNAVIEVRTTLEPKSLLEALLAIEHRLERTRHERWAPRTIDLDILAFGSRVVDSESMHIPHPRLGERRFVLEPWAEIAPDFHVPPPFNMTTAELLRRCTDPHAVRRVHSASQLTPDQ
ncbi:MAG: 2-amino-4-hydroxy-6-hydroxymethyldihydropteridine diphosphokinase [Rhodothermales bacterium]